MALSNSPAFPDTGLACGCEVTEVTALATGTGATTVFTAGTDGAHLHSISFTATTNCTGGYIYIYYNDATNNYLRRVLKIPDQWLLGMELRWDVPHAPIFVKGADLYKVGKTGQAATIHAVADVRGL